MNINIHEAFEGFSHKEVFEALNHLQNEGWWDRPEWAEKLAKFYHCSPGSAAVTTTAWEWLARSLYFEMPQ